MSTTKNNNENPEELKYSAETHLIYGKNISKKWDYAHHVVSPLSSSVVFRLDTVERGAEGFFEFANPEALQSELAPIYIYDRLGEPNKELLEENLQFIEKGEMAVTFASGMGAISGVLGVLLKSGDELIAHRTLYGCTFSLFHNWYPRLNIKYISTDLTETDNLPGLITPATRVIYFESPVNPNLDLIDIGQIRRIVDEENKNRDEENRIYIVVDNTFATPFCQRPIELGADFTVHSLTKGISGFGTDMGGAVIGPKKFQNLLLLFRKDFGAVLSSKAAWTILTYGLSTLHLRIKRQTENAMKIARFLSEHPKVEFVNYPGLESCKYHALAKKQMIDFSGNFAPGSMIFFGVKGESVDEQKKNGGKFMNFAAQNAYTLTLAVSLGLTRTLIEHPATMTHSVIPTEKLERHGIHPGGIRLAVGIEDPEDLIRDLEQSLDQI
ncbi:MAG: PLP-dependent transferase [Ignavibacteriales bacterium]|nr:MAG: cystathionine gamma-lyase [Ignavibacteriaceae bacterium]MBW7871813.1 PLP-dependent transferase [Ignavibacteria bacterium]MCZ2144337.1 PLP-dependent transferase [Ignavibacteriales bacterium]OQY72751.1 MAG: cystathionine gamma-lyase [Ignavibacteriales bacterium UTCHB3]MBV6446290.1 L-methionine gamma-lyase [Ignavibacteriaceae bacterium]